MQNNRRLLYLLLALLTLLALLNVSCGRASEPSADYSEPDNARAAVQSTPAAAATPTPAAATPTPAEKTPAAVAATPSAAATTAPQAANEDLSASLSQRDVQAVATLNQTWNATLESNPLAKGWVKVTLVSQGKVKLEGEMPDNDVNDGFMATTVRVFGVANVEDHIKKFPQPCGRDGRDCGPGKPQPTPNGAGAN
jgi:hypothetical protein